MRRPQLEIDTTKNVKTHGIVLRLHIDKDSISGEVGPWQADRWRKRAVGDRGGFAFGEDCEIAIHLRNYSDEGINAVVGVGGIRAHGSEVARRRIAGYTIGAEIVEVVEAMGPDADWDQVCDAVIAKASQLELDGLRLLDTRVILESVGAW